MKITYKRLWKLLVDMDLNKSDLIKKTKISSSTMAKLVHDKNVNTDILVKICDALNCKLDDIMELEDDE